MSAIVWYVQYDTERLEYRCECGMWSEGEYGEVEGCGGFKGSCGDVRCVGGMVWYCMVYCIDHYEGKRTNK
jgi:hypothetical protein